jgi:hypothetical protein
MVNWAEISEIKLFGPALGPEYKLQAGSYVIIVIPSEQQDLTYL